jgi:hypothetical protein
MFPPITRLRLLSASQRGSHLLTGTPPLATYAAATLLFILFLITASAHAQPTPQAVGTPGLAVDYYRGYFDDELSFFTTHTPAIRNRPVEQLNFPEAETDNFAVGNMAAYYSPGKPDEFSGRFQGQLYVMTAGTYTFYLGSDDAAYVWLDNNAKPVIFNKGDNFGFRESSGNCTLTPGLHTFRVDYGEHGGSQGLVLEYSGPDMPKQLVPNGVLYSEASAALRPTLKQFDVTTTGGRQVNVSWQTAAEKNCIAFIVQKSIDGLVFEDLARLPGAATTFTAQSYATVDQHPTMGWNFYRMQQLRSDRDPVYSPIKAIEVKPVPVNVSIYPVPNNGSFFVQMQPAPTTPALLELIDMSGRRQYSQRLDLGSGAPLQIKPDMATGLYMLHLTTEDGMYSQKISLGVLR